MILRPQQVQQLARGEPVTPANRSDSTSSASSTQNNYADRRNAVQNGIGVSGDNNSTSYFNISTTTDAGAVQAGIGAAIAGTANAINGMGAVATNAINANGAVAYNANNVVGGIAANAINANGAVASNANNIVASTASGAVSNMASVSKDVLSASSHLADVGLSMLQANTSLANSLFGGTQQSVQAVTGIAQQLAATQIAAQNDNRYLIAAGMAVVAIVGFAAFSKGK
ncbi:hypothetical protein PWR66_07710 [Paraburkholderia sp. A1RO-5]|uniref:hypothetical protein n=1 Tax=Paraburkholderia sp. A1RO-5 TaxID=3028369 RepID=UPI003B76524C